VTGTQIIIVGELGFVCILFVGLVIPMTAAIYWKKANTPGAVASIVSGVGSWLLLEAFQSTYPADLMAAGIGLVTMIAVTLLTQKRSPAKPVTDIDGNSIEYRNRLGILGFPRFK